MLKFSLPSVAATCLAAILTLSACSPKFDWREVQGGDAPYTVLMPAKPSSFSRPVNLDGMEVTMTMTAAEAGDVTFAVGTAQLPDAAKAPAALAAMKTAMVRNINGKITQEKITGPAAAPTTIDIEAVGTPGPDTGGQPRVLFARFTSKDKRVYQAVVLGKEQAVTREVVESFFSSFKN
jgi:hypothetical protein